MKKLLSVAIAAMAVGMFAGCRSTTQDAYRLPFEAKTVPAKFKPTVEVIENQGAAKGDASREKIFWFIPVAAPDKFSTNPSGLSFLDDELKSAAIYQACKATGADIILAPRFTEERYSSFLWFHRTRKVRVEGIPAKITGAEEIPVEQWPILFGANSGTQVIKTESK